MTDRTLNLPEGDTPDAVIARINAATGKTWRSTITDNYVDFSYFLPTPPNGLSQWINLIHSPHGDADNPWSWKHIRIVSKPEIGTIYADNFGNAATAEAAAEAALAFTPLDMGGEGITWYQGSNGNNYPRHPTWVAVLDGYPAEIIQTDPELFTWRRHHPVWRDLASMLDARHPYMHGEAPSFDTAAKAAVDAPRDFAGLLDSLAKQMRGQPTAPSDLRTGAFDALRSMMENEDQVPMARIEAARTMLTFIPPAPESPDTPNRTPLVEDTPPGMDCLLFLLTSRMGGCTVGDLVARAANNVGGARVLLREAGMDVRLAPPNCGVDGMALWVAYHNRQLAVLFASSPWATGAGRCGAWVHALSRIGSAASRTSFYCGGQTKAVLIPLSLILPRDGEA